MRQQIEIGQAIKSPGLFIDHQHGQAIDQLVNGKAVAGKNLLTWIDLEQVLGTIDITDHFTGLRPGAGSTEDQGDNRDN